MKKKIKWILAAIVSLVGALCLGGFIYFQFFFHLELFEEGPIKNVNLAGWEKLEKGMTKEEVADLLGESVSKSGKRSVISDGSKEFTLLETWEYNWSVGSSLFGSTHPKSYIVRFGPDEKLASWRKPLDEEISPEQEIPVATGFDFPVGKPDARGYHKERGFYPNVYPAEMWAGNGGGDTDLGDPVYSIGDGRVVIAKDAEEGWGGVILIRHGYQAKDGSVWYVDSFYAHIQKILVKSGDQVKRGQQIASIEDGDGRHTAHLRLEIRKNIKIGLNTASYSKDYSNYHAPTAFIIKNRRSPKP